MSFSTCAASTTFVDLATFSEIEGFLYGGPDAITWFVAAVQKANWFSYIPINLRQHGCCDFGQKNTCAHVNRSADYVLAIWLRAQIPQIWLYDPTGDTLFADASIRWTRNLMHNIFEKVSITFNELEVEEFDSHWLDFNFQFRKRGSKRVGYRNMIGDVASLTTPVAANTALGDGSYRSVPIAPPMWFGEDSGIALPVAALPFNDIKINYTFRKWEDLVVVYPGTAAAGGTRAATCGDVFQFQSTTERPALIDCMTQAHYAVVHNDERVKMGDAPRDMLIRQVQDTQCAPFKDISSRTCFDIRLSHSIILFCFAAQNISLLSVNSGNCGGEWSNYTTEPEYAGLDPIAFSTLVYENTCRLAQGSDYFSLIHPDLMSEATPDETGYHMWSYALKPWAFLEPSGSTNYSKLANVSIQHDMSPAAQDAAGLGPGGVPVDSSGQPLVYPDSSGVEQPFAQRFIHVFQAMNWNIARVANGSLGHPTL